MQFERLKITGFKSFAEPIVVQIPVGLTGVIGPNGCGKSNLVEAMRWVMGESSSKAMRAGEMDDVIFAGAAGRAERQFAEVSIVLNNDARSAPAIFNHEPMLEISRKLVRGAGSTYRVNGREVRARDVQLLFADAASGARSPSMVRQGQIAELIAAKPQARRRILEDAAGISGLAARQHEAELRLNGAAANLEKLDTTLNSLQQQQQALQKQAREAERYTKISHEIQQLEVKIACKQLEYADQIVTQLMHTLEVAQTDFATAQTQELQANTATTAALQSVEHIRKKLEAASHMVQDAKAAHKMLGIELARLQERVEGSTAQKLRLEEDLHRARTTLYEASGHIEALKAEQAHIATHLPQLEALAQAALEAFNTQEAARQQAEIVKNAAAVALAQAQTHSQMSAKLVAEAEAFVAAAQARHESALHAFEQAQHTHGQAADVSHAHAYAKQAQAEHERTKMAMDAAHAAQDVAMVQRQNTQQHLAQYRTQLQALTLERAALQRMLTPAHSTHHSTFRDAITVSAGFEIAVAAALQDELPASTHMGAPLYVQAIDTQTNDAPLPAGATVLAFYVQGVPALARRLAQIGVVENLSEYQPQALATGQKLVTLAGDVLRWDGLHISSARAQGAAQFLQHKNRLVELENLIADAQLRVSEAEHAHTQAQATYNEAQTQLQHAKQAEAEAMRARDGARAQMQAIEQKAQRAALAITAKHAALDMAAQQLANAHEMLTQRQNDVTQTPQLQGLEDTLALATTELKIRLEAATTARVQHEQLARQADALAARAQGVHGEIHTTQRRRDEAEWSLLRVQERMTTLEAELAQFHAHTPAAMQARLQQLNDEIARAQSELMAQQTAMTECEIAKRTAESAARAAGQATLQARDGVTRLQVQQEGATEALTRARTNVKVLLETHQLTPEQLEFQVHDREQSIDNIEILNEHLNRARQQRERLGAVNLIAAKDLREIEAQWSALQQDKADVEQAISQFRAAIEDLNRQGRARLQAAFDAVNVQFVRLFTTLFEGGEAELVRTQGEDPLESGLEIIARPPGKKPQTLSLLSGGEQALTAMALIFAVFLTNPSPICVLDEVDAPLDDANVERFCRLLSEMKRTTATRFLTITHNPITMAHMDQLYGVTMRERGVSQVVSVQLREAIELVDAA